MKNEMRKLTCDMLGWMGGDAYEEWRSGGFDCRRALTHAVMRELKAPAGWEMNGEYRSEFGGFFPVQCRFIPEHGRYDIALCSPGEVCDRWLMLMISADNAEVKMIRTLEAFKPVLINQLMSTAAYFELNGYSARNIIDALATEACK